MRILITVILFMTTLSGCGKSGDYDQWQEMAENDISLRPEYGNVAKTAHQIEVDEEFKRRTLEESEGNPLVASDKMSDIGFTYLYDKEDLATAMRRFNQAYLLNPENADVYYGYGSVFFSLGDMQKTREQYDKGLQLNPTHSAMLTDYGTTFLVDYYNGSKFDDDTGAKQLAKANEYMERSFELDNKNSDTIYKLSVVKMYRGECNQAKELFEKAKMMENQNITESYERDLSRKCR